MLIKKAIDYFDAFSTADIARISVLLSDGVCLRDWNVNVCGKDSVLRETENMISSLSNVQVEVVNIYQSNATIIAQLKIAAKGIESIEVVDIISFDRDEKIFSIRAYKG